MRMKTDAAAREGSEIKMNTATYYKEGRGFISVWFDLLTISSMRFQWDKGLYILSFGIAVYGVFGKLRPPCANAAGKVDGMVEIIYDLQNMPGAMNSWAWVTVVSRGFALFAMFIYLTSR